VSIFGPAKIDCLASLDKFWRLRGSCEANNYDPPGADL